LHIPWIEHLDNVNSSGASALFSVLSNLSFRSTSGNILGRRLSLETLVSDLAPFQVTDHRDKVYGLLGLAKDTWLDSTRTAAIPFQPCYGRSVLQVYTDFVAHCVHTSGCLGIFRRPWAPLRRTKWQDNFVDPDLHFSVPSWISVLGELPFGDPSAKRAIRVHGNSLVGSASSRIYSASNGRLASVGYRMDNGNRVYDGSISVKGLLLGTITELSTRMADGIILKECLNMIGGVTRNENGILKSISDTLWQTLCANRDGHGKPAPSVYRIALLHLLQKFPNHCSIDTIELIEAGQPDYIMEFLKRIQAVTWNRRVFLAAPDSPNDEPLLGLAPRDAQVGDRICILFGGSVPFVLRRHQKMANSCWEPISESYVNGKMDGEALIGLSKESIKATQTEFEIR
jgi:hypothetical protein